MARAENATRLVALEDAGVRRGGRWLVRGLDFAIGRGEVVTLIGPNGGGKSTTVKLALGIIRADAGRVHRKPGISIGYVPQKLSVERTLPLSVRRLMRLTRPLADKVLEDALAATGVAHLADSQLRHLSGGEFQRVLLARAIAARPDLLVLDEPVQGVDFAGESALYDLILRLRDETGCAILMVSHDLHMVMAGTDTVICINSHICCRGTPQIVSQSPDYQRLFGARAGALALYSHHHDHQHLPDGRVLLADGTIADHCHASHEHSVGEAVAESDAPAEAKAMAGRAGGA